MHNTHNKQLQSCDLTTITGALEYIRLKKWFDNSIEEYSIDFEYDSDDEVNINNIVIQIELSVDTDTNIEDYSMDFETDTDVDTIEPEEVDTDIEEYDCGGYDYDYELLPSNISIYSDFETIPLLDYTYKYDRVMIELKRIIDELLHQ